MTDNLYDPAAGGVGYLTFDEWDRLTRAWVTAMKNLQWWWVAGHIRGGDDQEMRVRSTEHSLPLPATWLAAHEITRLMQELNRWPELEDAANDVDGSELARLLIREVQTAAAKWPMSDRSHRVSYFRCESCQQMTLKYLPPNLKLRSDAPTVEVEVRQADGSMKRLQLLDVVVRCTDKACGEVMDSRMFERAAFVIKSEQEARDAKRRMATRGAGRGKVRQVGADDPSLGVDGESSPVASEADVVVFPA